jgi:hypothetical protein
MFHFTESGLYIGIFLILAGLLNCFFGYKLFKILLGVIGFIVGGYFTGRIVYSMTGNSTAAIVVGVIIGIIIALIAFFFYTGGVFIIGASFGAFIALMFNFHVDSMIRVAIIIIFAVAGGVLAIVFQKFMVIISTSFGGGSCIANGLLYSYYMLIGKTFSIGKYYNFIQRDTVIYISMIAAALVIGIIGIIFQYRSTNN